MADMNRTSRSPRSTIGLVGELIKNARLAWRLLNDRRVDTLYKVIPFVLVGLYFFSPIDFIPDFIPVVGELDDLAVILLGIKFFIDLSPKEAVQQHLAEMTSVTGRYRPSNEKSTEESTIEAPYTVREK
ncbi:MAG: hypothetical protein A2Z04_06350 [Chloroflexi bacterium RBG_16_57_9]|nr:MAG: hypothetical protein A2Z04_06350 [Chloroflexi bacterium RBG_16_57_9]